MNSIRLVAGFLVASLTAAAQAGPPYLTDDPSPTEPGHWEIYAFGAGEHSRASESEELDAEGGLDLNYGAMEAVQLSATLPLSLSHAAFNGWRSGTGDLELAVKYRFVNEEQRHLSAAIFPRAILPTSSLERHERAKLLLPLWVEKDFPGNISIFGGGGYEFNPGAGHRDFWQAAMAVTHDFDQRISLGGEIAWQQPDTAGGSNQLRAGFGSIIKLSHHHALLFSAGPTWMNHQTGYHFYAALGLDL